ncbi:30S ribosomal protein S9 [Candidatus Woesearchaeota archaeon]|nr:30S ribosomal protein S9 [Candidatus Woesearchaeota archaeon]
MKDTTIVTQGKRKQAIARAALRPGKGKVKINGTFLDYYGERLLQMRIAEPLVLVGDLAQKIDIDVTVNGGGVNGQADAIRLAIARALVQHDKKFKKTFDEYDRLLLVADVRRKEVRKPNDSKARAKRQKSYR